MRHEEQVRMGAATTLDEPVSETIVSNFLENCLLNFMFAI